MSDDHDFVYNRLDEDGFTRFLEGLEQPIGHEQFAAIMRQIAAAARRDAEEPHEHADRLMVAILRALGYGEGVTIFENMKRWYA